MFEKVRQVTSKLSYEYGHAIGSSSLNLPPNQPSLEIVLEAEDFKGDEWKYYIVHHATKHLLWFCEHTLTTNVYQGAESGAHVGESFVVDFGDTDKVNVLEGHLLQVEYYQHLAYYPHYQNLSDDFIGETQGILTWGLTGQFHAQYLDLGKINICISWSYFPSDSLTSLDSLTPYDEKTMDRFLKLIKYAKGTVTDLSQTAPHVYLSIFKDVKGPAPAHYIATAGIISVTTYMA